MTTEKTKAEKVRKKRTTEIICKSYVSYTNKELK